MKKAVVMLASVLVFACGPQQGSPYKVYVTNRDSGVVSVTSPAFGQKAWSIRVGNEPTYATASHRGDLVFVTNSGDATVSVISTTTDSVIGTVAVGGLPKGIEFTPGDRYVLVADEGADQVVVIAPRTLVVLRRIDVGSEPHNFAFDPDADLAYVTCGGTDSVDVIDLGTMEKSGSLPAGSQPHNLVFIDGMLVVTSRDRPMVYFTDLDGLHDSIEVTDGHHGITVGGQGRYLRGYVTGVGSDLVNVLDLARREVVQTTSVGDGPHGIKASPDDLLYYVAVPRSNWVRAVSMPHGMTAREIECPGSPFWIAIARTKYLSEDQVGEPGHITIDAQELQRMMTEDDPLLVNVHTPYSGEIAGTDAHIPFDRISEYRELLPADQTQRIVVYCRSGPMSEIAAQALVEAGYTNVCNLSDGYSHWKALGLPFEVRER